MTGLAWSVAAFFGGAGLCLAAKDHPAWLRRIGPATTVAGALLGIAPCFAALAGSSMTPLRLPWNLPFGSLMMRMDALLMECAL